MKIIRNKSIILAALFILAGVAIVFAQSGGYGRGPGTGYGSGWGGHMAQGMGDLTDPGWMGEGDYDSRPHNYRLSKEDTEKLEVARQRFSNETRLLREQISHRRLTMQAELIKQNPDSARLTRIQQELSQLKAQFDQQALQHRMEVSKIVPNVAGMHRDERTGRN